jgi:hypothetical protein
MVKASRELAEKSRARDHGCMNDWTMSSRLLAAHTEPTRSRPHHLVPGTMDERRRPWFSRFLPRVIDEPSTVTGAVPTLAMAS